MSASRHSSPHGSKAGSKQASPAGSKRASPAGSKNGSASNSRSNSAERSVKVYMALYEPYDSRDPRHWAIYIRDSSGHDSIHQLIDKHENGGYKVDKVRWDKQPERSSKFYKKIQVGTMPAGSVDTARSIIQAQYVDNRSTTWNCQSWALEALESLEDESRLGYVADHSSLRDVKKYRQNWQ